MQACDRFKQYDWSKWNLLHVGLNRSIHEILAMFRGGGGVQGFPMEFLDEKMFLKYFHKNPRG
jgi:hypothetical protein